MEQPTELLFEYLRNILYDPAKAQLDADALPAEFQRLGEGLLYFAQSMNEMRDFASALARGDLSADYPSRENELAAPLKALHASLKHMTWQSQQVAKGDYQQRLEFLGEFADAFNTMVVQLAERQSALEAEIEAGRRKTLALEQSVDLFEEVTRESSLLLYVLDRATGETLFENQAARKMLREEPHGEQLRAWLANVALDSGNAAQELCFNGRDATLFLSVKLYPVRWRERDAVACSLRDITDEKELVTHLENTANTDSLTGVCSRHYGMEVLARWLETKKTFCLCFVDLDNLKYVNDTFGHGMGDLYIIDAAEAIRGFSRDSVVSRLGGDEFMLLAPGVRMARAEREMERIREEFISSGNDEHGPRGMSYGLVEVADGDRRVASELLAVADARMYTYKRAHKAHQPIRDTR